MKGIVIKSTGSWYQVENEENQMFECRIPGKFRLQGIKSTNPVAVGDLVEFDLEKNKQTGVIKVIRDRKNYLVRKSVNLSKRIHIIASNVDLAFLLITIDNPRTHRAFIDRFISSTEAYGIETVLVFNKIDTYNEKARAEKEILIDLYSSIGYQCIEVSALEKINLDLIKDLMKGKVSIFSGHSGVGKSTLVNSIDSKLDIKTKEISEIHQQGKHTTTFAEMHKLDFGGYIIDTPGIKGFGIIDLEENEIGDYFKEFFKIKGQCKFHNCRHINEPKCAIKDGLETGIIAKSRYKSYLQIIAGDDEHYRDGV